jgi:hypothetical protein
MSATEGLTRWRGSAHLDRMVAELERLATEVGAAADARAAADPEGLVALVRTVDASAITATLRLDGADPDLARGERAGTWFDAVGQTARAAAAGPAGGTADASDTDEVDDAKLAARELAGVTAALRADDLVEAMVRRPGPTLAELSRRLTRGLVAPERAGAVRRGARIVHDASVGRVLYFPLEAEHVPDALAELAAWIDRSATSVPPLLLSGVVALEVLRIHPFDAANGRLARAAARLLLRGGGLDPHRLAAFEPVLGEDPLGVAEEVAASLRRRDATAWLERHAEAVADGLRASRALLAGRAPTTWEPVTFTLAEHAAALGVDVDAARADVERLVDAHAVRRVPGSGGLRLRRAMLDESAVERPAVRPSGPAGRATR